MNEKINTWRTLQDLPPAVTSFWCRFDWHTWTKWSDPKKEFSASSYFKQVRFCIHCNSVQSKKFSE